MNMQTLFQTLPAEWFSLKSQIDQQLQIALQRLEGPSDLKEACCYAVLEGGKRFRPTLALLMAQAAGSDRHPLEAAISVELFHAASLVADDLPCMDNDELRRGRLTVHKKFGTATALMTTFALIAEGFAALTRACRELDTGDPGHRNERTLLAFESASQSTGICGITGGQFSDLNTSKRDRDSLCDVLRKKTGSLFDMAFAFGWIFGYGRVDQLPQVQILGSHLGTAFQLCDDFDDCEAQGANSATLNTVESLGKERALDLLQELLQRCKSTALQLSLHTGTMGNLLLAFDDYLIARQTESASALLS